ncbi:MAG: dienelactone hydrolase family protein [Pseudomonadales bacterium]|nr:dienelactone hydrolase family protein [Pseudomonadales bacterium]
MCDNHSPEENEYMLKMASLNRRQFARLGITTAIAMLLPPLANAQDVMESEVRIQTPDGSADCYFVHPASGSHPAVLMWPDILGLRPASLAMGKRLAQAGYSVLVVNPFYRIAKAPVIPDGASFADPEIAGIVRPMMASLTAQSDISDAGAFLAWIDQQAAVDTRRKIGSVGYCMGGPQVLRTVSSFPARVGAGATFHGVNLATQNPDSPHLGIPNMDARLLIAIAENDDARDLEVKTTLRNACAAAGVPAEIEVYADALHGWTVPDFPVYNQALAERAWGRLLDTFATALV